MISLPEKRFWCKKTYFSTGKHILGPEKIFLYREKHILRSEERISPSFFNCVIIFVGLEKANSLKENHFLDQKKNGPAKSIFGLEKSIFGLETYVCRFFPWYI